MRSLITTAMLIALALPAAAQVQGDFSVADPPPLLNGTIKAKIAYTVPFLTTNAANDRVAFCVACTSTEKTGGKDFRFGVELIDFGIQLENDVTQGEGVPSPLSPGQTRVVCTRATDYFVASTNLDDPTVDLGSARVLSERSNLICAAYSLDPNGARPAHFAALPMFKTTKQRGD